jgi:X-X-X-Leu-X-X-Gly heptad repeat protein
MRVTHLLGVPCAGAGVVQVSSGLGTLASQSPAYQEAIIKAGSLEELEAAVAFLESDPQKDVMMHAYSLSKVRTRCHPWGVS